MRRAVTILCCILCAVLCVLLLTLAFSPASPFSSSAEDINWPQFWSDFWAEHDSLTWVTVGDSITAGSLDYTQGGRYYFQWIRERLEKELGKEVTVVDPAVGGAHLTQFNDREAVWVEPYAPELVTVLFGGNDGFMDQTVVRAAFDGLLSKLVPTPENVARGVPEDRVVVLITCYPIQYGPESEGEMRLVHAYGQELSRRWCSRGYPVAYIDLYTIFGETFPYGQGGNLASLGEYMDPISGVHPNLQGQYAIAQVLMKEMGLYSPDSPLCNIPHTDLIGDLTAQALELDYTLAGSRAALASLEEDPLPITGTILALGGSETAGDGLQPVSLRTWSDLTEAFLRCELRQDSLHFTTVAGEECSPRWIRENLLSVVDRCGWPREILYMPNPSEIYSAGYVHTPGALDDYAQDLSAIVDICAELGSHLTLLTPIPAAGKEENAILDDYVRRLRLVAAQRGVPLCDGYAVLQSAMEKDPQAAATWYSEGVPNYMAQMETARILLRWGGYTDPLFDYPCYQSAKP